MRIMIVGSGYVGLVTGACLADLGHTIVCIDRDAARTRALQAGQVPIFEPGLAEVIARNVAAGRLTFECGMRPLGSAIDAVFIAVGTPARSADQRPDLSAVTAVAADIAANAHRRIVVATKSTVPPGTGDMVEQIIRSARPDLELAVVSNPEFLREGNAIGDFMTPDRICVGCDSSYGREIMTSIYRPLVERGAPLQLVGRRAAELVKYAANAFLAVKISFINEIADLCEAIGADVEDVAHGIGLDRRIGGNFLRAGPGYGGSCFPKDSTGLLTTAQDLGVDLKIVSATVAANRTRKQAMASRVVRAMGGDVRGRRIAVLGLTFKPDTDDLRESPALELIAALAAAGADIRAYDPQGMDRARELLPAIAYADSAHDCLVGADAIVLATEWSAFRELDPAAVATLARGRVVVDLRNALDAAAFAAAGFVVHGIGRRPVRPLAVTFAPGAHRPADRRRHGAPAARHRPHPAAPALAASP